jgi:hypothetical protein
MYTWFVRQAPGRDRFRSLGRKRETKNRQLEAKPAAVVGIEVAGHVPPFVAILRMRSMVRWKRKRTRCCRFFEALVAVTSKQVRQLRALRILSGSGAGQHGARNQQDGCQFEDALPPFLQDD